MKAQVINQFGDASVFELVDLPKPSLKPGHVLIKVFATSVNQIDIKIRSGAVPGLSPQFPAILNSDVAGVIDAVADDVTEFKVGDEVYGCAGGLGNTPGALSAFMLADTKLIALKPKNITMREAAALPLVTITAWEALFKKAKLTKGKTLLIHGGLGGVGHIALQLAKSSGAKVVATVLKDADIPLAKSLGADEVINAKEETVEHYVKRLTNGLGFDIVFDTIGGANLNNSFLAAALNGDVVTTVSRATYDLTIMHNKALSLHVVFMLLPILNGIGREDHGKILSNVASIVEDNQLKPMIDSHHFTLEQIKEAHELLESGKARGKIVLSI